MANDCLAKIPRKREALYVKLKGEKKELSVNAGKINVGEPENR